MWRILIHIVPVMFLVGAVHAQPLDHAQGEMAGEVTATSVILQSRLTRGRVPVEGDVPGGAGVARFEVSTSPEFHGSRKTAWLDATAEHDFIVKAKVSDLKPGARYHYRLRYGVDRESTGVGDPCTFTTLAGREGVKPVRFVVVTGMMYDFFHHGRDGKGRGTYDGEDKHLGFPALETMRNLRPDFFVGTGDNVYYDASDLRGKRARTQADMRRKWHEQFLQPRFASLFAEVPTYWEKDDHDFRYNDCDLTGDLAPAPALGIRTFLEQVPVVDPNDPDPRTYRTHRVSRDLQIWLVEGRDYRSPNKPPDGPGKSIWGTRQKQWLEQTLIDSDATFKILISPTPMVGPDDGYKRDNHTNPRGFRHEGEAFFRWLTDQGFLTGHFYLVCGDRHWQYHSIHLSGFEEFSCGALVDANARIGRKPGDPKSTDPEGRVRQLYTQTEPSGGFLEVEVAPGRGKQAPTATFTFRDEQGTELYRTTKRAPRKDE